MDLISKIDWAFLEAFFGEWGKIITTIIALLVTAISLAVAVFRYLCADIAKKERDAANLRLREEQKSVDEKEIELVARDAALRQAIAALESRERRIEQHEKTLNNVRTALIGKEHDLWCLHAAQRPDGYGTLMRFRQRDKPVVLVANLKGGVGKSTLTTNLAAFFKESGKRVLLTIKALCPTRCCQPTASTTSLLSLISC